MSLYFVSRGRVRITTRAGGGAGTDLAVLGAGEFFGETALVEEVPRAAGAVAAGDCLLFELFRGDLDRWVKTNPQQAVQFFAELVQIQSQRLRRTSGELALFFDLFDLLGDPKMTAPAFLPLVLERLLPRLEGSPALAVYLRGAAGPDLALAAARGGTGFAPAEKAPPDPAARAGWLDDSTYRAYLRGSKPLGCLVLRSRSGLSAAARADKARTLEAAARFLASALEILASRSGPSS